MTTPAVTADMIRRAQAGDGDAMWEVVSAHESVLASIVRKAAPSASPAELDDLMQEARVELIARLRSYDTSSDAALSTYTFHAIRRAVTEEWIRMTCSHTVEPSAVLRVRQALAETEGNVEGAWIRISLVGKAKRGMSRETFLSVMGALAGTMSLEAPQHGSDDTTLADTIPDPVDADDVEGRRELANWLLDSIAPRQALTLRSTYGIRTEALADEEIAELLGTTKRAVAQLRHTAGQRMRQVAASHGLNIARGLNEAPSVAQAA
ncbi:sigma-70 family RNA polymerase sigma factor [Streptomyces sp. NBC_00239]|uniref:sigma-70 family RNA polymerase sigma factor n=1 Tax=Streptomyces sp. NBC_00239 TaxID=2903640 RepID=UPI002E2BC8F5|nr:sigma-70 family RNA polymerase sigma factor [Streptomyces sp. NBC_00239]